MSGSVYSFHPIDCENVTTEELDALRYDGELDSDKVIVFHVQAQAALSHLDIRQYVGKFLEEAFPLPPTSNQPSST